MDNVKPDRCPTCQRPYSKNRSNNQNRYYWSVVIRALCDHTGYTEDEMHEVLKYKFLSYPIIILEENDKEEIHVAKSTTRLTTKEFEEFMTKIRQWASLKLGCWIPEPNEAPIN